MVNFGLIRGLSPPWASTGRYALTAHVRRLVQFGLVGALGAIVNTVLLFLLAEVCGLHHLIAAAVASEAAILHNFTLNNCWTFGDLELLHSWTRRAVGYNVVALSGLVISLVVLAALTTLLGLHYLIANVFAMGAATLWNYGLNARFTWQPQPLARL